MMNYLNPCKICGGLPEYYNKYVETEFGDNKCVAVMCSRCKARTALYMCSDNDSEVYRVIEDLWNRGRITNVDGS